MGEKTRQTIRTFTKIQTSSASDVSGDGFLDAYELEAIFNPELEKVYNLADPNEDKNEMEEERQNMREHVLKEVDSDGDTAISLAEFMAYIQTDEFINPTNKYKMIDELISKGELSYFVFF